MADVKNEKESENMTKEKNSQKITTPDEEMDISTDEKNVSEEMNASADDKNLTESEIMATYQGTFHLSNLENKENEQQVNQPKRSLGAYQNKNEKAADVKSSAITLFLVGGLGLIADILCVLDLTPIHFTTSGKIITCGTMGILFLCMVIFGFVSMKSFKGLVYQANEEDKLTNEIEKWDKKELTKEIIEEGLFTTQEESLPDELKYFKRSRKILALLNHKFMNLDQSYADNIGERIYQYIYEEDN